MSIWLFFATSLSLVFCSVANAYEVVTHMDISVQSYRKSAPNSGTVYLFQIEISLV